MPEPTSVNRADYEWCDGCDAFIPKKLLKPRTAFFSDEVSGWSCPAGHKIEKKPEPKPEPKA